MTRSTALSFAKDAIFSNSFTFIGTHSAIAAIPAFPGAQYIFSAYALERARQNGIDAVCLSPKDFPDRAAFNRAFLEKVNEYAPDLIVLAGFLVNIPPEMIRAYPNRIINIHPSLIPSFCGTGYYGLKVHEAALARGVKVTGATVHFVDDGTDTGPILLQKSVDVLPSPASHNQNLHLFYSCRHQAVSFLL